MVDPSMALDRPARPTAAPPDPRGSARTAPGGTAAPTAAPTAVPTHAGTCPHPASADRPIGGRD